MNQQGMPSIGHEEVSHATRRYQATPLLLIRFRWHGLWKACSVEGEKRAEMFAAQEGTAGASPLPMESGSMSGMSLLCCQEGVCPIALLLGPHGEENSHPDIGERAYGDGVTFALLALALIVRSRPGLAQGRLPGKLVQRVSQRFDTALPSMGFGVVAAGKQHWRGSTEGLQTCGIRVAAAIIPNFCQQARRKALSGSGERGPHRTVSMRQKRASMSLSY
jgi:hypothetical protein